MGLTCLARRTTRATPILKSRKPQTFPAVSCNQPLRLNRSRVVNLVNQIVENIARGFVLIDHPVFTFAITPPSFCVRSARALLTAFCIGLRYVLPQRTSASSRKRSGPQCRVIQFPKFPANFATRSRSWAMVAFSAPFSMLSEVFRSAKSLRCFSDRSISRGHGCGGLGAVFR